MITMSLNAYLKMKYLTFVTDLEVQAFLLGDNKNRIYIEDLYVLKQEVSGAHTEVDAEQIADWITNLVKEGKEDVVQKIIGTFHSHNTMETFWSATDNENIETLGKSIPVVVSVVSSKKDGELKLLCRVDFFKPMRVTVDDIDFKIEGINNMIENKKITKLQDNYLILDNGIKLQIQKVILEDSEIKKQMENEINTKCFKPVYQTIYDYYHPEAMEDFELMLNSLPDDSLVNLSNGIRVKAKFVKLYPQLYDLAYQYFMLKKGGGKDGDKSDRQQNEKFADGIGDSFSETENIPENYEAFGEQFQQDCS